jgi:hypothetical protein
MRFGRRWFIHWITSLLVSLVFVVLLKPFEHTSIFRALDRWGADAVMQVYAAGAGEQGPGVVVVDMGMSVATADLAETLGKIRKAKPLAVGIDFIIVPDVPKKSEGNAASADFIVPLDQLLTELGEAGWGKTRIALPVINSRLANGIAKLDRVRPAAPDFVRDEDGLVRTTRERVCGDSPEGGATLPTLAAAMVGDVVAPKSYGCEAENHPRRIIFTPIRLPETDPRSGVLLVPREAVGTMPTLLAGAYVVIGHIEPDSTADTFMTPVGEMPGALIHAQSVRTLASGQPSDWARRYVSPLLLRPEGFISLVAGAALSLVAGAAFAAYMAVFDRNETGEDRRSFANVIYRFVFGGIGGLVLIGFVLLCVGVLWTWLAARLVEEGLLLGALTPMFGAMLELLAHVGENLVAPMKWLAQRLIPRGILPVLLSLLCVSSATARAEDCFGELVTVTGELKDVRVQPGERLVTRLPVHLKPFDRVIVTNARTSVLVEQVVGTERRKMHLNGADFPEKAGVILPPCSPRPGLVGAWDAFWDALNADAGTQLRSSGATLVYRSANGSQTRAGGPLRELTNLAPATGVVVNSLGLALAWAGGSPPYSVAIEDEASGKSLGRGEAVDQNLWLAEWRTPAEPFVVIVRDAEGAELWRHLRPLQPPPVGDIDLGEAILLFESAPTYRLEALRRLVARATGGDILAGRAVELLKLSGGGE